MQLKTLTITGEKQDAPAYSSTVNLQPVASYKLSGATRDSLESHKIDVRNNDKILEFVFDDDTNWICDASTLHELFPESQTASRDENQGFQIPSTIKTPVTERGLFGDIALKLLNVFAKKAIPGGIGKLADRMEDKLMEEGEGLLKVDSKFNLQSYQKKESAKPWLLFLHGTNSNTRGAFGGLGGTPVWTFIQTNYADQVISFQHRTLTKSPLQNVAELAEQLPDSAEIHIISHSRGGLVGDILSRYSLNSNNSIAGFTDENIELLKKEGRQADIDFIRFLQKAFAKKKIRVTKFVRVASPSAGTKLASKRLDTILNVLFNLFGKLNPIADVLKELIAETLRTKDDVAVLPGIEAMNPNSPFIKILNDRTATQLTDGASLMVISGNGKVSVSFSGLLVILGKLFYWQRNDLVVNTDSMYLGTTRSGNIQYFFDQGAAVDHVKYFNNDSTREAIRFALKAVNGTNIPGFKTSSQLGVPAADRAALEYGDLFPSPNPPSGKRPIVVLLPGIMGSNIAKNDSKLWLAYLKAIGGGLKDLENLTDAEIKAISVVKTSYKKLADRLSYSYDVVVYPFDWRKQLNECAKELNEKLLALMKYNQPIKLIGHSMGGVLVRDFIINHDDTWKKLDASEGFRLLFLGSPLGGSFRILTVLFGEDAIINSLNFLDRKHTKKELLQLFSKFPGILSLLPIRKDAGYDFADRSTWQKMADAHGDSDWPIPSNEDLKTFGKYRDGILSKSPDIDYRNAVYIAGKDKFTPCDYYNDTIPPRTELVFIATSEGDQSVTWASAIPQKMTDAGTVYYSNSTHGALANDPDLFDAIEQILEKGATTHLSKTPTLKRGESRTFRMPEVYNFDYTERGLENVILGISEDSKDAPAKLPLSVSVSNGDLSYCTYPILAGHFANDGILYAEKVVDECVNGSLSARHKLLLYPGEIGSNTVVSTDPAIIRFPGAIIVGMGEPGRLTSYELAKTVEQGIAKYLLNVNSKPGEKKVIGISSLIIACGYGGLSIENSIRAIIEGINNANTKVQALYEKNVRTVQHLEFIELYEDKALSCFHALSNIEAKENNVYNIQIGSNSIRKLFGSHQRLQLPSSDEWWTRITIKKKTELENGEPVSSFVFTASTGDAREEQAELFSSSPVIDLFLKQVSIQNNWSPFTAKTLFELLIPNEFKERLKRKANISWILDSATAEYPWELLQDKSIDAKPLCINAGMIRQLSTENYRQNIKRVATENALIVADPLLEGFIPQLDGAKREGERIEAMLNTHGYPHTSLINRTASDIILNLHCSDYKIIHLAGHGVYNPSSIRKSGMVIGNDVFLTVFDVKQMTTVPELVFVNCCHLGNQNAADEKYTRDRYKLAANIGLLLIEIGVKAVVAAGWAVDDQAALEFSETFYDRMFSGYTFGDAVNDARSVIYERYGNTNTWGAYQCYGDPFYQLTNRTIGRKTSSREYKLEAEALIDLKNLNNQLDTRSLKPKSALVKLDSISEAIAKAGFRNGEILEQQALTYYELGEFALANARYELLRKEEAASFSVAALEKYYNSLCKQAVLDSATSSAKSLKVIKDVISRLNDLLRIDHTAERLNMLGAAYKRMALISPAEEKADLYAKAGELYQKAYRATRKSYALNSWIMVDHTLSFGPASRTKTAEKEIAELITEVRSRRNADPSMYKNMDYWSTTDHINFDFSLWALGAEEITTDFLDGLTDKYITVWKEAGSRGKKIAEIENLIILSDILSLSKSKDAKSARQKIDKAKSMLEKEIMEH